MMDSEAPKTSLEVALVAGWASWCEDFEIVVVPEGVWLNDIFCVSG